MKIPLSKFVLETEEENPESIIVEFNKTYVVDLYTAGFNSTFTGRPIKLVGLFQETENCVIQFEVLDNPHIKTKFISVGEIKSLKEAKQWISSNL